MVAGLEAPSVPALMRGERDGFCCSPPGSSGQTAPPLTEGPLFFFCFFWVHFDASVFAPETGVSISLAQALFLVRSCSSPHPLTLAFSSFSIVPNQRLH